MGDLPDECAEGDGQLDVGLGENLGDEAGVRLPAQVGLVADLPRLDPVSLRPRRVLQLGAPPAQLAQRRTISVHSSQYTIWQPAGRGAKDLGPFKSHVCNARVAAIGRVDSITDVAGRICLGRHSDQDQKEQPPSGQAPTCLASH